MDERTEEVIKYGRRDQCGETGRVVGDEHVRGDGGNQRTVYEQGEAAILPDSRERFDGKTRRTRASKKGHNEYAALRSKLAEAPDEQ